MSQQKRSLAVDLGGLVLPTPVLIAAGCAGTGRELVGLVELRRVGGIVTRTITVDARPGAAPPRIAESPSGIVWRTGLANPGIDAFIATELPTWIKAGPPLVVSIGGGTLEEYVRLTGALQGQPGVHAVEIDLSGPDDELQRPMLGAHVDRVSEIVGAVARMSLVPVFAKVPGGLDVVPIALAAARAGASCLTLTGSPPAFVLDATSRTAVPGPATGWLSGPAVKPLMLRALIDVARALPRMPLLASGGIATAADAIDALLAGASAVQVGVAAMIDPTAPVTIARGIVEELQRRSLISPMQLRGLAIAAPPEARPS
ncbi:MAG: dihydroorotate dehydrogenase [Actinomycetota bacterium]